ncbi:MAG TPA: hypothetical protein VGM05_32450 [Planctomycetaceae bacterium]|jgi:hypothetical protein
MKDKENPAGKVAGPGFRLLEYMTAGVLLLVLGVLAWMTVAAYSPIAPGAVVSDQQVIAVNVLLVTALGLVSVVALLYTRK